MGPREQEFRGLFVQEAEARLEHMVQELLELEAVGNDAELIASIFRDAHTLKGAAAVVGIEEFGRVAHALEDLLEQLRSGERLPSPELIDAVLVAVDGLRTALPGIVRGEDAVPDAGELEAALRAAAAGLPAGRDRRRDHRGRRLGLPGAGALPSPAEVAAAHGLIPPLPSPSEAASAPVVPEPVVPEPVVPEPIGPPPAPVPAEPPPPPGPPTERRRPVADGETARVPLSRLDELVRLVGESAAAHLRLGRMLTERLATDPGSVPEFRDLSRTLNDLQEKTMRARMVPVSTITESLHRGVRDAARITGKQVRWEVRGDDTELDRGLLQQISDPLLHLVRNAVDHGIEDPAARVAAGKSEVGSVRLHAMQLGSEVILAVSDDGAGIDVAAVRQAAARTGTDPSDMSDDEALYLAFRSGLSTAAYVTDVSGRGVGLDVVRAGVDAVRGRIEVHSEPGQGSEFRLIVPITLAVLPCLLVTAGGQALAIPMHSVLLAVAGDGDGHAEGRPVIRVGQQALAVSDLAGVLGGGAGSAGPVVVLAGLTRKHAFQVDGLSGQRDVVVKGLPRLLPRLEVLAGASVEPDGRILPVLDAPGLIARARLARRPGPSPLEGAGGGQGRERAAQAVRILVVDDALTLRELQRSILERAGYSVRTASHGAEALARMAEEVPDLVLTDIEMPGMDGFTLTAAIRAQPVLANLPVVILTSRASDDDRRRGLEAGADAYIVKSAFDETALLGIVERLLGHASPRTP